MSNYKKINNKDFTIALWRIEEDIAFFESKFNLHPHIQNENKKLQWFATRYLLNQMLETDAEVLKYESGKPYLKNLQHHISISHTSQFAAVMISTGHSVGIDLETIAPKVQHIAHKFLREDEINSIAENEKNEKLILYWSAKESLYKMYGKRQVEFKTHLLIEPFQLKTHGTLNAEIVAGNTLIKNLKVQYEFFDNHVMSYVGNLME